MFLEIEMRLAKLPRITILLVFEAALLSASDAPAVAQQLYVIGRSGTLADIKAVSYDGQLTSSFDLPGAGYQTVAFDDPIRPQFAFVPNRGLPSLRRISLVDGAIMEVTTDQTPSEIATDHIHQRIYYSFGPGAIQSARYDGTDPRVETTSSGATKAISVDPYGGWFYWSFGRSILRKPIAGGATETIHGPVLFGNRPFDIQLDLVHGALYWSEWEPIEQGQIPESGAGRIMRSNLDGSNPHVVLQDVSFDDIPGVPEIEINPMSFAIDPVAGILFADNVQDGTLVKFCLDGSCYDDDFARGIGIEAADMAVIPAIPEPSTLALAGVGVVLLVVVRLRRPK
jgi:hypothetical protein